MERIDLTLLLCREVSVLIRLHEWRQEKAQQYAADECSQLWSRVTMARTPLG